MVTTTVADRTHGMRSAHVPHRMYATRSAEAGPKARSATDIPRRIHLRRVASANVRCALAMDRRALAMSRRALAMSRRALAMSRRALAMSRAEVLRMRCCLARAVRIAHNLAEI